MECKPKNNHLFTVNNPKTTKGESLGYMTLILHLSPYKDNDHDVNLCHFATKECIALCLNDSGQAAIMGKNGVIRKARRRKSNEFIEDRHGFLEKLISEILYYQRRALKMGLELVVRLNGTSDIEWSQVRLNGKKNIFQLFPGLQFYDYTKNLGIVLDGESFKNYHVTFSWSGKNEQECIKAQKIGVNIAVPFVGKKEDPLPEWFLEWPVLNGDETDLRFLDKRMHVVGLKVKGHRQRKVVKSSFLVNIERL